MILGTVGGGHLQLQSLSISTLLENALSKVSFSNLLTNDFLDHPKASENFFIFTLLTFTLSKNTLLKV